jgi:transcriptional regulator with XRE-family HTH domain
VKPRKIVGHRIQEARARLGYSQRQLADVLSDLAGRNEKGGPWFPQTVAQAEQGDRAFTVDDLVALSIALQTDVASLITPPPGETMDIGPHRFSDWDEQPQIPEELVLAEALERAAQTLRGTTLDITPDLPRGEVTKG